VLATPELYQINKQTLRFTLHPGQAKAWRSKSRFTFVIAGTQSGKTSFVPIWIDREIREQGHGDYLAATATYDLFKLKFLPEMRHYFVSMMGWHEDKVDRVFWKEYKPGLFDRIILRSASSEGGLESATVKAAVLDECGQDDFRVGAWEAVQRRLSLSQGRVLGTTTPYNLGWLKQQVYDRWRAGDADYRVIQFASIMNPAFPRAEYDRAKLTLPKWKFEMFYNGQFTRPAGMIYEDFVDDYKEAGGHKEHPFTIPPEWPRYVGIDFGAVHTALIWVAEDPTLHIYHLYREYLQGSKSTQGHVSEVKQVGKNENVLVYTGGAKSETQQRMDWTEAGISVQEPIIADVEAGIDRVIELLKTKRLFIFDSCHGVLDEFGTYSREIDDLGQPLEKIKDKETFHRLDSVRYVGGSLSRPVTFFDNW
jgi:hypothetical protein